MNAITGQLSLEVAKHGWGLARLDVKNAEQMEDALLSIASAFGKPRKGRQHKLVERLTPVEKNEAHPCTLSEKYGLDDFPFHVDGSHWTTPPRYVALGCLDAGVSDVPTLLVDWNAIGLSAMDLQRLKTAIYWVRNGRYSFYSTILSNDRFFVRYDPGCMHPQTSEAEAISNDFLERLRSSVPQTIHWKAGQVLVIDNWRMLHARGQATFAQGTRILLRCVSVC